MLTVYLIFMTAFGVGWGGGDTTFIEILWLWKGMITLFIFSLLSVIGIYRYKKAGLIFGFVIIILVLVYIIAMFVSSLIFGNVTSLTDVIIFLGYLSITLSLLFGLNKLRTVMEKFSSRNYITIIFLIALLILLFLTLFFE